MALVGYTDTFSIVLEFCRNFDCIFGGGFVFHRHAGDGAMLVSSWWVS
jgi:hypothetical protein